MAQGIPPLHYLSQLYPVPNISFDWQDPGATAAIPQRAAAGFYNLPSLESLLHPDAVSAASSGAADVPTFAGVTRSFDSFMPGYRESANVEDRRGRFDDMMYAAYLDESDPYWRSGGPAPLMKRFR